MIPPRDCEILHSVARYDTLTRAQVTRLHFPTDDDGRVTRKRLRILRELGLVNQTTMRVASPSVNGGVTGPVYYPSARGMEFLNGARAESEPPYLLNTAAPHWMFLYHFVAVAETHRLLDLAIQLRADVRVVRWYGERSILDPGAKEPEKRYVLYEVVSAVPRVVCVPDAAFLLEKEGHRKVFYLEQDRDTTKGAERVAAQKCGGFAGLFAQRLHLRQFPTANSEKFLVLMLAPSPVRRDALKRAVSLRPGAELWRFASLTDLQPETFLSAPIWHPISGEPKALIQGGPS